MTKSGFDAAARIEKFLTEWRKGRFNGEIIHGMHVGSEDRHALLTVTDLEAILKALRNQEQAA